MSDRGDEKRQHEFDALRAAMMLLGLVIHSAISYTKVPIGPAWPFKDAYNSVGFDFVLFIIHLFRMPTFFVMAGFFAALLYDREGRVGFLKHRIRRLLLPSAAAWVLLYPVTKAGFVYACSGGATRGISAALADISTKPYDQPTLIHLWFIYYLFMLCIAAAAVMPLVERIPVGMRTRFLGLFGRATSAWWGVLIAAAFTVLTLLPMDYPALDTPRLFVPVPRILLAYAVFMAFGWLLYARRDLVSVFGQHPWRFLLVGMVVSFVYMGLILSPSAGQRAFRLAGMITGSLAIWLLIYGIMGLFVRYCHNLSPVQRYLSDGSYWMYLLHASFTIWLAGLQAQMSLPAGLKFLIVLSGTTFATLTTYYLFVRSTVIGEFLNGRRYARAMFPKAGQVQSRSD